MSLNNTPSIILVKPQMGENIGASARAMMNCGLTDLSIVNPRDGWPSEKANAMSVGALDLMPPVQVFDKTEEAIKEYHYVYATTARPRDMVKPVMTAHSAIADIKKRTSEGQKTAIIFGGERAGLSNEDISHADAIITIPLNPDFSSLNLAQSVLLCGYEWSQTEYEAENKTIPQGDSFPASKTDFNNLMQRLEEELDAHNFFRNDDMKPSMMRNIRSLLSRAELTDQEVRTMQGIISALIGKKTS